MINSRTTRRLAVAVAVAGTALGLATVSAPERPGEVRRSCLAPQRAAELLGWHPRTTLPDGLAATLTSMARETRRARGA